MKSFLKKVAIVGVISSSLIFTQSSALANMGLPFLSSSDTTPSLAPMLEETMPAVVSISVEGKTTARQEIPEMFRPFFGGQGGQTQERPFRSLGSGVIVDAKKGYIVTNAHVVDNADKILVLYNGSIIEEGNHQALIDRQGMYYQLIQKQISQAS